MLKAAYKHGIGHAQQDGRVEGRRAGPDDQQHAQEAADDGHPAARVQPFAQPPGRHQRDQHRHRELDGAGLGQLQVLQGPEVQRRHRSHHHRTQRLQLRALHAHDGQALARRQQQHHPQHMGGKAQPHHLGHRQVLHQPLASTAAPSSAPWPTGWPAAPKARTPSARPELAGYLSDEIAPALAALGFTVADPPQPGAGRAARC
jgi:hypothetical protein